MSTNAIVVVDHFTKCVEAEALTSITPRKIKKFIYKNIVCPIISDNGKLFDRK